jgi:hypothetical protein
MNCLIKNLHETDMLLGNTKDNENVIPAPDYELRGQAPAGIQKDSGFRVPRLRTSRAGKHGMTKRGIFV